MKYIDKRNQQFQNSREVVHNTDEIIGHIRKHLFKPTKQIPIVIVLLLQVGIISAYVMNVVGANGTYQLLDVVVLLGLVGVLGAVLHTMRVNYRWRRGLSDEQILAQMKAHGKLLDGTVIDIDADDVMIQYQANGKRKERFTTAQAQQLAVDDTVAIVRIHGTCAILL